jgi:hypothetical protein
MVARPPRAEWAYTASPAREIQHSAMNHQEIAVGFTAQGRFYDGVNLMIRFVLDQTFSRGNT